MKKGHCLRAISIALGLLSALAVTACGGRSGRPPAPPVIPPALAPPTLAGVIGQRPFIGRSALMVMVNERARKCSRPGGCSTDRDGVDVFVSRIIVFEREVTCADLVPSQGYRPTYAPGEHVIALQMQGPWPVFPNSIWKTDERDPLRDQLMDISFVRQGSSGGALAKGTLQFLHAERGGGVLSLDATTMNANLDASGSVRGTIPFVACR